MGAVYTGAFELRRLVVKFARTPSGGVTEDYAAFTVDLAKLTGGAPDSNWLTADYTAVEGRFDTWWTAAKVQFASNIKLSEYRFYKDGPAWAPDDLADGPANPAARITARSVAGTDAVSSVMPPQVAMSVTKVIDVRKRWGRIYLPAPAGVLADVDGRLNAPSSFLPALVTCFNGCRTDGKQPVVFSRGRSAYVTSRGTHIDAHAASAYEITGLQMDNVFDTVRSRRWSTPTIRTLTALT